MFEVFQNSVVSGMAFCNGKKACWLGKLKLRRFRQFEIVNRRLKRMMAGLSFVRQRLLDTQYKGQLFSGIFFNA